METQTQPFSDQYINQLKSDSSAFHLLHAEINKIIVGQQETVPFVLMAILCNGHILLEGVPGVAKTTLIKTVSSALGLSFKRIQFTPDLLPADLIGTLIYNQKTQEFETRKGPIFAHLVLADEINRAPAKVQSALLEAMQERQVTIGNSTYKLDEPFLVFATQNPIEQEGTYRLPEAQVDRFMFKLSITYPNSSEEREIIRRQSAPVEVLQVLSKEAITQAQELVKHIYVNEKIVDYIVNLVQATRNSEKEFIQCGASPRATINLHVAAKAHAFLKGRHFVTPDDVKTIAPAVLRHRITLSYEAEAMHMTSDEIVRKILATVPSP